LGIPVVWGLSGVTSRVSDGDLVQPDASQQALWTLDLGS
jgi:phosphohistidine swiveling domain-containing protein